MPTRFSPDGPSPTPRSRRVVWGGLAALLLVPAAGTRASEEMAWGPEDFVFAAVMLGLLGLAFEIAARRTGSAYRAALAVAVSTAFALTWVNVAVGILGTEDDPANLLFFGVLGIGALGALLARFRARGMARALGVAALAQVLTAAIVLAGGWGDAHPTWPWGFILGSAAVTGAWLLSAWLFHRAAEDEPHDPARL